MSETKSTSPQPGAPYVVPKRFGLRTLLFVTTFFGLIFAAAKATPAPAIALIFYSSFLVFISLAQMLLPQYPRLASILAGALFMPAGVYGAEFTPLGAEFIPKVLPGLTGQNELQWLIVIGGFLGYLGGTLLAGIFMVSDLLARFSRLSIRWARSSGKREGSA